MKPFFTWNLVIIYLLVKSVEINFYFFLTVKYTPKYSPAGMGSVVASIIVFIFILILIIHLWNVLHYAIGGS